MVNNRPAAIQFSGICVSLKVAAVGIMAGVDRARLRVVAGESGRRMIIGGCEDNEDLYVGRGS